MAVSVLGDLLRTRPAAAPGLISPSAGAFSYGDLASRVDALAHDLAVLPGQAVALALPNGVPLVFAFFAIAALGATVCPLNPGYTQAEFEFYLNDIAPALLLVPSGFLGLHSTSPCVAAARKLGVRVKEVGFERAVPCNPSSLATRPHVRPDDVALILHTSGTTGRPKAVPLTHANLLATAGNICTTYALSPADNTYLVQVLFHIHGIVAALLAPLLSGGRITLPDKFDPSKTWSEFQRHGCTWLTAVPSILQILLHAPAPPALHIRFLRSCSSPLGPSTLAQLEARFGVPVLEAYAMTEAAHQMTSNPLPPLGAPRAAWKRKPGSVGLAQGVEIAIYGTDGVESVPTGVHGDVCVRAASVTKGYINNAGANQDAFLPDGFFRTGDRGYLDRDGYLTLVGRNSEIINRGGEKISPIEVDAALLGCSPAIREAVCFSVPDELMGQEIEAVVVLAKGQDALDEAGVQVFVGRVLADFKIPKRIHFVEGAIPKGPTGKIQRKVLSEKFGRKVGSIAAPPADVGETVKTLLAELLRLDMSVMNSERTLFDLGADSITFIRLVSALRARGISGVRAADLFRNPSIGELVALVQRGRAGESRAMEEDPEPFSLLGAGCNAADVAVQLGVRAEDVEDAFPLLRGQALMYRAAVSMQGTEVWFVGDVVELRAGVDVERWIAAWNVVYEHEACLRGTLVGRLAGQDAAYADDVNTAYLAPEASAPLWVTLRANSKDDARAAVAGYAAGLRHAVGMHAVHFVLAAHPGGTLFSLVYAHLFLEAGSREMVQDVAAAVYLRPETIVQRRGCGPWARYVRYALRIRPDEVFWRKDFAPTRRLAEFHTTRRDEKGGVPAVRRKHVVLDLPMAEMSAALGVSVPLLAESAFCLAVSLYWSQIGGRTEPAFYAKGVNRRYEAVEGIFDMRGAPYEMNSVLTSVDAAHHSIWAFVQSFMLRMRAVESAEQSLEYAKTRTAMAFFWRLQRPVPEWDQLARLVDSVWRPVCPTEISMRRITPTKFMVYQMQEVWFEDDFKRKGCKAELLDIAAKTLAFYALGGLENKTYEDLSDAVFASGTISEEREPRPRL